MEVTQREAKANLEQITDFRTFLVTIISIADVLEFHTDCIWDFCSAAHSWKQQLSTLFHACINSQTVGYFVIFGSVKNWNAMVGPVAVLSLLYSHKKLKIIQIKPQWLDFFWIQKFDLSTDWLTVSKLLLLIIDFGKSDLNLVRVNFQSS